jgi:hypothetical protein
MHPNPACDVIAAKCGLIPPPSHKRRSGTMIWLNISPALVLNAKIYPYSPNGYARPIIINPEQIVYVLSPEPTIAVLRAGHKIQIHPTIATNH